MIYAQASVEYPYTPVKLVFLTGLSNPANCKLSDVQEEFMASLEFPESWKVYRNFPWTDGKDEWLSPPLWRASFHNGWQFLLASTPLFRRIASSHWHNMLRSTEHLLVIAGSCGLQIANCLLASPMSCRTQINLLGIGPVAWRIPRINYRFIQSNNDYLSRLFFRKVERRLAGSGHMKYLEDQRMKELTEQWISDSISK